MWDSFQGSSLERDVAGGSVPAVEIFDFRGANFGRSALIKV
jgi:hypothetical protein